MTGESPRGTVPQCHTGGIAAAHDAGMDDERFFCPDCCAEHREPLEATLGHIAR